MKRSNTATAHRDDYTLGHDDGYGDGYAGDGYRRDDSDLEGYVADGRHAYRNGYLDGYADGVADAAGGYDYGTGPGAAEDEDES